MSYADDEHYAEAVAANGNNGSAHAAGLSFLEVNHRVDYDGDYVIQAGLAGQRGAHGEARDDGLLDGQQVVAHRRGSDNSVRKPSISRRTKNASLRCFCRKACIPSGLGLSTTNSLRSSPKNRHTIASSNKYPTYIGFLGPEQPTEPPASRKMILIRDPNAGPEAIEKIVSTLARRAYRRPVTKEEMDGLMKLVATARSEGLTPEQCVQVAIQGILVSPAFLFHIEQSQKSGGFRRRAPHFGF